MTKAEREALRKMLAGPKVEWRALEDDRFVCAGDCHWLGERYAVQVYQLATDNWAWWVGKIGVLGTGHGLPTLEAAKTAAETWLADALFPHRRKMLALLDWADRVEEWVRGLGTSHWAAGIGDGLCGLCPALVPGKHHPDCPFAAPEFAELFGEEASPNDELAERASRLSVFLATLYASVERALAERRAGGATGEEREGDA